MSGPRGVNIKNHIPAGITKFNNIIVAKGRGCQIWDKTGKQYLDMTAGIGALSTGHCHPKVVSRVQEQVGTLQMGQQNCFLSHPMHEELTQRLLKLMPITTVIQAAKYPKIVRPDVKEGSKTGAPAQASSTPSSPSQKQTAYASARTYSSEAGAGAGINESIFEGDPLEYQNNGNVPLDSYFFTNCGSECTDNSIKIARMATGKSNVIALKGGFHGRTLMASSVTSSKVSYRYGFQPLMSGCFFSETNRESFEDLLYGQTGPGETCAVILEPVQGEAGVHMIDPEFMRYLRRTCTENNIMLIFDEVQSGAGRTGKMWASEHSGVVPDIMTFAKGIASGFPMGGIACSKKLTDLMSANSLGGTGGGNPVCLAASNATLEVIAEENLIENAQRMGVYVKSGLDSLKTTLDTKQFPVIQSVRQYGLFCAIDLNPELALSMDVIAKAVEFDLVMISCGKNSLRVIPPLVITQQEIDFFLERLELTLKAFAK